MSLFRDAATMPKDSGDTKGGLVYHQHIIAIDGVVQVPPLIIVNGNVEGGVKHLTVQVWAEDHPVSLGQKHNRAAKRTFIFCCKAVWVARLTTCDLLVPGLPRKM